MIAMPNSTCAGFVTGMPGWVEGLVILVAILLLFGGKKLPEIARGLGRGLRIFKQEIKGIKDTAEDEGGDEAEQPQAEGDENSPPP